MFRISFIPSLILHKKIRGSAGVPTWGPDVTPRFSRPLVLLAVFFSTYIMSGACILSFKSESKSFWCSICQKTYVLKTKFNWLVQLSF